MHEPVKQYLGFFRKQLTLWQAVALIVSATVGAGVLGIPFAIAQFGVIPGVLLIGTLGIVMMVLNLLIAMVCDHTAEPLQLVGFARKYIGRFGEAVMMVVFYISMLSVLLIYIIGVGETLAAVFGGNEQIYAIGFFIFASALVMRGLRTLKTVELILSIGMLTIILCMSAISAPHISVENALWTNLSNIVLPYGVVLFAFHAAFAIPEAHALLPKKNRLFEKAVILAGIITTVIYAVFASMVVSVTGLATTEIATIGLGTVVGPSMLYLGNAFAVIAMGTSFLLVALSLKHSIEWDLQFPQWLSATLVLGIPLALYLFGITSFIGVIGTVGGILVSIEMILSVLIFIRAVQKKDVRINPVKKFGVYVLAIVLLAFLSVGFYLSVLQVL